MEPFVGDPRSEAVLAPGRSPLTYARLAEQVVGIGSSLRTLGIRRTDRVALVLPSGPDLAVALVGISRGAVAAPLNPDLQAGEFDVLLAALGARALVTLPGSASQAVVAARARGIAVVELVAGAEAGAFGLEGKARPCDGPFGEHPPGEKRFVVFTSGTTSRPKAVPLSGANLEAWSRNFRSAVGLSARDRCLNVVPLFHAQGLGGAILPSLDAGGSVVCTPGFDADRFEGWLAAFRPTWYTAGPALHQAILETVQRRADSLRFVRSISAPLSPRLMADLEKALGAPVIEGYGMTETGTIASNPLPPGLRKPGSVGVAAGLEVAILDEKGSPAAPGGIGEIVTRGDAVMPGYEHDPELNREAFILGWFRTGDLGRMDEDGYLYITGRLKEIINRAGEKVSPGEVEEALSAHPGVAQAAAFAVPDARLGEDVAAAVVPRAGASISPDELRAFAAARIAAFKVPRRIVFLEEIPKGPTGKVQRAGLARRLGLEAAPRGPRPLFVAPASEAERTLAPMWRRLLGVDEIGVDESFFDLGGDSILGAQLFDDIERATGKRLPLATLVRASTLRQLAAVLVAGGETPASPHRVLIQDGAGRPPFFCVHGIFGGVVFLKPLALALGGDQPVYGLQARGVVGGDPPVDRVEEMADLYLRDILEAQPEGPYYLGGWSFGGLVALEMAQRLLAAGRKVGLLAVLDSRRLPAQGQKRADGGKREARLKILFGQAELLGMSPFSPELGRHRAIQRACWRAEGKYAPRRYDGRIHLVWSTGAGTAQTEMARESWARIAGGGIECFEVKSDHLSVLREPHLREVAAALRRWLDLAISSGGI